MTKTHAATAPVRAATYGRQSKQREDESAGSPTAQREAAVNFVAAREWQHVGHYEDLGASGYDPKAARPGLDALLAAVHRGEVDRLVVYRLDRLTRRGVVEAVRLVGDLADHGAALASVNEPFLDTSTPMGRGIFAIFAALAEQESANISQRVTATKGVLRRAGSFAGGPRPFGYVTAREFRDGLSLTVLEPEPTEAAVVADVASRVLAGASIAGEARRLNVERIRTSSGAEWATSTVSRLLKSPTVAGYMVERRFATPAKPGGKATGPYDQVIVRDETGLPMEAWTPLVPPADWHRLQAVIGGRSGGRGPRPTPTLLGGSGLLHCASCGSRMGGDRRADGKGSYRCMKHRRGSDECAGAGVSMPHLDAHLAGLVWDRLRDLDPSDAADLHLLKAVAIRYNATTSDPEADAHARMTEALIADVEAALAQLDDDRAAGIFPGVTGTDRYRRQAVALSERAEAARASLLTIPRRISPDDLDGVMDLLAALRYEGLDHRDPTSPWSLWTNDERRDFLALFLDDVTVSKATGPGGGDKVAWRGHERLTIRWVDEVAPF